MRVSLKDVEYKFLIVLFYYKAKIIHNVYNSILCIYSALGRNTFGVSVNNSTVNTGNRYIKFSNDSISYVLCLLLLNTIYLNM